MGMQMKKFQAPTLQKAIERIRQELGDGAVILQAEPITSGKFGRNGVEVTAAIDRKELPPRFSAKISTSSDERDLVARSTLGTTSKGDWKKFFKTPFKSQKENKSFTSKTTQPQSSQSRVDEFVKEATGKTSIESSRLSSNESSMSQMMAMQTYLDPLKKELEDLRSSVTNAEKAKTGRQPSGAYLESELSSLKATLNSYIQDRKYETTELSAEVRRLVQFWQDKGMSNQQIYHFLSQLEKEGVDLVSAGSQDQFKPLLEKKICGANSIQSPKPRIVTLIGPTGVGKTTTIAKLAAYEKLKLHRKVALVTIDDFKIGGADQLGHYARILEIPFIKTRQDYTLEEQIAHLDVDTIFIDTFGCSSKDDAKIQRLRKHLNFKDPVISSRQEIHLALPVGISPKDVDSQLEAFSRIDPSFLLFTKWDETENWGGMLATILQSQRPVSYVGNGQDVPDDLAIFSSESFIETVTGIEN